MGPAPQKILIVRPSALGDVARTVPALVSLKRSFPDARIDWLVNEAFAQAISAHPDLHEVVPFPRQRLSRFGWRPSATRKGLRYFRELRRRRYDAVYDLQGLGRSGWLTWVTGAPGRIGPRDARELGWLGYNRRVRISPGCTHTVDRMLAVLEGDGVPAVRDLRLYTGAAHQEWANGWLHENRLDRAMFAVIAPAAAWESKRWPAERFGAVIDGLGAEGFAGAVIVGSEGERPQLARLLRGSSKLRLIDLVGRTSVGQLMAIIEDSGLVIANDSAPLHLAVGLGRRCVGLFGPTDPAKVGPYGYPMGVVAAGGSGGLNYRAVDAVRSPIAAITVEQVLEKVRQVMSSAPPTPAPGRGEVSAASAT